MPSPAKEIAMLRMLTDLLAWTGALAQHRRGARALAGWNDHELADIGLESKCQTLSGSPGRALPKIGRAHV